jgi:hypothetical protein
VEGQFPFHQDREGVPGHLSQVQAHHVKELFRGFANLLENIENFRYIDFQLHGVSPFWFVLANRQFKGNTPFFIPLKFHTIDFTLPANRLDSTISVLTMLNNYIDLDISKRRL